MKAEEDESQLVSDACQGSISAFETLLTRYEPRIRRMIYSLTHDVQLTQDLCQETFLAAYRAMPRMKGVALQFAPWLYRIALNQVRSEWRRRKYITWIPFPTPHGNNEEAFDGPGEDYLVCDDRFEERVMERELVNRVLAQLPSASVLCLLLDAEGFTYKEIAVVLQDSLSAVRSRLSRARQAFQHLYLQLNQEGDA